MVKITFDVPDEELQQILEKVAGIFAFKIQREIIERVPRRFRNRFSVTRDGAEWVVGTNDEIFSFWELGTRPHEIRAKFVNSLAFQWPSAPSIPGQPGADGRYRFKKVWHPGTQGNEVLEDIARNTALLEKLLDEAMQEAR